MWWKCCCHVRDFIGKHWLFDTFSLFFVYSCSPYCKHYRSFNAWTTGNVGWGALITYLCESALWTEKGLSLILGVTQFKNLFWCSAGSSYPMSKIMQTDVFLLLHLLAWPNLVWLGTSAQHSSDFHFHYYRATCVRMSLTDDTNSFWLSVVKRFFLHIFPMGVSCSFDSNLWTHC